MDLEVKKGKWGKTGCLIIFAIIILSPILYIAGRYLMNLWEVRNKGESVVKLLDENYHDKFAIAEGHYNWGNDSYQFTAYPVNEPDFKFSVLISRLSKSGMHCSYLFLRQVHNLEKQVKHFVDAVTPKNFLLANIGTTTSMKGKLMQEYSDYMYSNNITSPDILLKRFPYMLGNYTGITYCYDVTEENKEKIAKDIYKLLCFYREKKFGLIQISISFYSSNLWGNEKFRKETENKPGNSGYDFSNFEGVPIYKATYGIGITEKSSDTKRIENYKEIEDLITKYKSIK